MPAADSATSACPPPARLPRAPHPRARSRWPGRPGRSLAAVSALALLAGCGGSTAATGSGGQPPAAATATATSSPSGSAPAAGGTRPGMVGVTKAGALVVLSRRTGSPARTLVPSGVLGDEISVASNGIVYFAVAQGCTDDIESIADTGGSPVVITPGDHPAISPDGTKLAYASQPSLTRGCVPSTPDLTPLYKVIVRTLSTGAQTTYPMVPSGQDSGLPAPISHLSWAADNQHLAVSISSVEDNEGWNVALMDVPAAQYYTTGAGVSDVAVTGQPNKRDSYLREGVYLPDGNLFVSRACCAGVPVRNTSRLMWEVSPGGALVHQVAVGFASLEHTSLDATANGKWLLYLAGHDLYVSHGGATPRQLGGGLIAAAWK
jgi:hypothetical protein